jgi:YtkA-like
MTTHRIAWFGLSRTASLGLLALAVAACSGGTFGETEEPVDLKVEGDLGKLTFQISSSEPISEGSNDLRIVVTMDGNPFTQSSVSAIVRMASMTHGGSAPEVVELGEGEFMLTDVELSMPGQWQIMVAAENTEVLKVSDTALFTLEIP